MKLCDENHTKYLSRGNLYIIKNKTTEKIELSGFDDGYDTNIKKIGKVECSFAMPLLIRFVDKRGRNS